MAQDREGKFPPPETVAELIYHWMRTWPNADLSRERMAELYPYIVEKWRQGWSLIQIAQTACSCTDGRTITPSPVATKQIPNRRLSLPPVGVEPGTVFGADEIRDAPTVARLKLQSEVAELRFKELAVQIEILYKRKAVAANPSAKAKLQEQIDKAVAKQTEVNQLREEAQQRLGVLESTGKVPASSRKPRKATRAPAKPKAAPKAKAPKAARKPAKEKSAPASPTAAPAKPANPPAMGAADVSSVEDKIADLFKDE